MKKFIILTLICFIQNVFSQARDSKTKRIEVVKIDPDYKPRIIDQIISEEDKVYNTSAIDTKPEFPRGPEFLSAFIEQNFKTQNEDIKGKVYATFIIEKDGSLSDIKILRDIGFGTKEEAIRVLKLSPKWIPGKLNGKEVRVLYVIPMYINYH